MTETKKKNTPKWLEKLKNIKHIEIYIVVIFITILALIYTSSLKKKSVFSKSGTSNDLTVTSYIDNLETDLESILSNIGGVSNVKVMITLDMENLSLENSKITLSTFPAIKGIIVTAKGVSNTNTKMKVLQAIEAVIDVKNGNVQILSCE